jgi:DNA repair protein RecN (Recombination protein N)
VSDRIADVLAALSRSQPLEAQAGRARALSAEVEDLAAELRGLAETIAEDPVRLEAVRARRQQLRELRRKYGESLADVIEFARQARARRDELDSHASAVARIEAEREQAGLELAEAERAIGKARRAAAPELARAVEAHFASLALGGARLEIEVGEADPGDEVSFLLSANPGQPPLPLAKVASGGELARAMLAARLVLTQGPPVLIFDEVDAGVGGQAAVAVGRSLAALAPTHQVLVVTHLPQVAAFADQQIAVRKVVEKGQTLTTATRVTDSERVVELSRMLAGHPDSDAARRHAEELLASARRQP